MSIFFSFFALIKKKKQKYVFGKKFKIEIIYKCRNLEIIYELLKQLLLISVSLSYIFMNN